MTIIECEKRNKAILQNAIEWANNRVCEPLEQTDVALVGECLKINIPKAFYQFVESKNINEIKACGCHKTIFKTLDKIKNMILKGKLIY